MQKLLCEAISQGEMSIRIPGGCVVFSDNGRGLGRSLGYVGRSQTTLLMMLHGSVVHKLPFEQLRLKLLHGTVVQKLPFKATSHLLHGAVVRKLVHELLHATVVQKPPCKTIS